MIDAIARIFKLEVHDIIIRIPGDIVSQNFLLILINGRPAAVVCGYRAIPDADADGIPAKVSSALLKRVMKVVVRLRQ